MNVTNKISAGEATRDVHVRPAGADDVPWIVKIDEVATGRTEAAILARPL